ncbi:MAG: coenzyme F420-0:L-glutamate ligase [Patescibacteria group bacterium]
MKITPVKTAVIGDKSKTILEIIDESVHSLSEKSIVAVTSKIVSLCEGSYIEREKVANKDDLITSEADYFIPRPQQKHTIMITIKDGMLIATSGIDESNANGFYILWPEDAYRSANEIRKHLRAKYKIKDLGVIITDSKTSPMRRGTTGFSISYSGIKPLRKYIGHGDLFGRKMKMTFSNLVDGFGATAVVAMGEGDEQTPLAILEDVGNIQFCAEDPTQEEIESMKIGLDMDLYSPFLSKVDWQEGGSGKNRQK